MIKKLIHFSLILIIGLSSCNSEKTGTKQTVNSEVNKNLPKLNIIVNSTRFAIGDSVEISFKLKNKINPDSIILSYNNKKIFRSKDINQNYILSLKNSTTGNQYLQLQAYKDSAYHVSTKNLIVVAANKPKNYSYKVINKFPHDRSAYTQGLFFENGFFYEATGQKGESSLRKVDPKTGEVLTNLAVPSNIFGEGITAFGDKIVQLSWHAGIGFVYNKSNFQLLEQFNYTTEGWGLTTDSTYIIMSDGTNNIYFLNPENYSEVKRIQVFDDKKPVEYLNELEYIDGKIWANIFTSDIIAIINPEIGNVEAYINLKNILDNKLRKTDTDVLNGIAYDKNSDKLYVTGKKWPLLFEIELIEKE